MNRKSGRPREPSSTAATAPSARHGLARVISRRGYCSRSQVAALIAAGRVRVDGQRLLDPEWPTDAAAHIDIDGLAIETAVPVYLMLNKPRGCVVSASDERGRNTVYDLLTEPSLPWLGPVGRLDKASEGLLLLSNDTGWAAGITEPAGQLLKTYHVQVGGLPDAAALTAMITGVDHGGERLSARSASLLRHGEKNAWLEIVLDEGRNRQIRRLLAGLDFEVLRLIRVAIGDLALGTLPKGRWRRLGTAEVERLRTARRVSDPATRRSGKTGRDQAS